MAARLVHAPRRNEGTTRARVPCVLALLTAASLSAPAVGLTHRHSPSVHEDRPNGASGISSTRADPARFVVYSRIFHDSPFAEFWVEWYLELGFTIVLLDTFGHRSLNVSDPSRLRIERVKNRDDDVLRKYAGLAWNTPGVEWVLLVDLDEFLSLNASGIAEFVDDVEARHGRVDVMQFRWVVINNMSPECTAQPLRALVSAARPVLTEVVKSMSRPSSTRVWNTHRPRPRARAGVYRIVTDGMAWTSNGAHSALGLHYLPLAQRPSFDSALIHLQVRSLADHFTKALNSRIGDRAVRCPAPHTPIAALINSSQAIAPDDVLRQLLPLVGVKATKPLVQARVVGPSFQCEHGLSDAAVQARLAALLAHSPRGAAHRSMPYCIVAEERAELARQLDALGVTRDSWGSFAATLHQAYARHMRYVAEHPRGCGMLAPCSRCEGSAWELSSGTDCYKQLSRCLTVRPTP